MALYSDTFIRVCVRDKRRTCACAYARMFVNTADAYRVKRERRKRDTTFPSIVHRVYAENYVAQVAGILQIWAVT